MKKGIITAKQCTIEAVIMNPNALLTNSQERSAR